MRLLTLTATALFLAGPLLRADDRKTPPDADAQAKAEAQIKDLFKEDFAKRKPADLQALASKLIQAAADTKGDLPGQFVLLRLAAEVAAKGGDAADALQAIDAQAKDFAVNAAALKAQALDGVLRATGGATIDYQVILDAALPAADDAQAADDFDSAGRLLHAASVAANKVSNKQLATVASERGKLVDAMQKEYDNIKAELAVLKDKPEDPDASLHVGRFLCFYKGDWDRGLPLLAICSDAKLKDLAKKDVNGPVAAADQAALADAWMDVADAEAGARVQQIQLHAYSWYKQAAPQLAGLDKAKAEKRIKDLDKVAERLTAPNLKDTTPEPGWVVLLRSLNPTLWDTDTNQGKYAYAIPLSKAPDGVQYLKMNIVGSKEYVIIPMTNDNLKKRIDYDTVGWDGENRLSWHGCHLGIYSLPLQNDFPRDNVVISWVDFRGQSLGWGFGHRIHRDDVQGYSWAGVPAASAVFEISVKAGPLTDAEAKHLLGKEKKDKDK
jgi:hypothetical protein